MKKFTFLLILSILLYIFLESSSLFALFLIKRIRHLTYSPIRISLSDEQKEELANWLKNPKYLVYSSTLGWTIKNNGVSTLYRSNPQGIRANKEYQLKPNQNVLRISSFGDSFTHCDEVKNENTWQEQLNKLNPNLEVINFGVMAYGLDQAFLRYQQDGIKYNSKIVFIGFMSVDIFRTVNVYRPFLSQLNASPLTKPRFIIQEDRIILKKNPIQKISQYNNLLTQPEVMLPELGRNDLFYQGRYKEGFFDFLPSVRLIKMVYYKFVNMDVASTISNGYYNKDSEAFKITVKIFEKFYDNVERNNSIPIIILFPSKGDIVRHRNAKPKRYSLLIEFFETKSYQYIDIMDAFDVYGKEYEIKELFKRKRHYTPLANKFIAKYLLRYLQDYNLMEIGVTHKRALVK